ncbi:MAG: pentapeptide repeat-containing protein [Proteobacteria bacterium]|nr:pentapeptide repeat-containing protein [Pseudomonadota bacterium]
MFVWEWLAVKIEGWRFSRFIGVVQPYAIIIAIFAFAIELGDRTEERSARAWQLVNTPSQGNSGKIEALQFLNQQDYLFWPDFVVSPPPLGWDSWWPKEPKWWPLSKQKTRLVQIDLTPKGVNRVGEYPGKCTYRTFLFKVHLPNAILPLAKLNCVFLAEANLGWANLNAANLNGAILSKANLSKANLSGADLSGAYLSGADLSGAVLTGAVLTGANLSEVKNLTQNQLEAVRPSPSPTSLPDGLTWPFVEKDGEWVLKE